MRISTVWFMGWSALSLAFPLSTRNDTDAHKNTGAQSRRLATYVQSFNTLAGGNMSLLPIRDQQTHVTHAILAAIHIEDTPGVIHLNDNDIDSTYWDVIWAEAALLQSAGTKVMMMLGGAAPGSYQRLCSGNGDGPGSVLVSMHHPQDNCNHTDSIQNEAYYLPLQKTLKLHKIDGLDLDIEEVVPLACPLALLQRLHADFGREFILTMAPVASDLEPSGRGLGGFSYLHLDAQALSSEKPNGKLIDWFNVQFYNGWGDASSTVGYTSIVNNGFDPSRVAMGILSSPQDGGSGWYPRYTYVATISQLIATYPNFGGVVSWEYHDSGFGDEEGDVVDSTGARSRGQGTFQDDPWMWQAQIGQILQSPAQEIPPTDVPPSTFPPTDISPTEIPPADVAPTDVPPTEIAPTDIAPMDPMEIAPTDIPPTDTELTDEDPSDAAARPGKVLPFDGASATLPRLNTPYPDAFHKLTISGVPNIDATWALNITAGNITAAIGVLQILDDVVEAGISTAVGLVQNVGGVLNDIIV
jgi:hypothetical protein